MKKELLLICMLFVYVNSFSQKIDLDRYYFKNKYRNLPSKPIDSKLRTYKNEIITVLTEKLVEPSNFRIDGFIYDESKPSFIVKYKFSSLFFDKVEVVERLEEIKNKEGIITARNYYYKNVVDYSIPAECIITRTDGSVIYSNNNKIVKKFTSGEYSNRTDANNYWNNNKDALRQTFYSESVSEYLRNTTNLLNEQIGYTVKSFDYNLWITDSPKHPENDAYIDACKKMSTYLTNLSATEVYDFSKVSELDFIKYFNELPSKYIKDEKPDRKLRYGAYYNLALFYLLIDQPELCNEFAEKLIANDYDKFDGRTFKSVAESLKGKFSLVKFNKTRFSDAFLDTL